MEKRIEDINPENIKKVLEIAENDYARQVERQNIIVKRITLIFTISSVAITYTLSNIKSLDWCSITSVVLLILALGFLVFVLLNTSYESITANSFDLNLLEAEPEVLSLYLLSLYKIITPKMRKRMNRSFIAIKLIVIFIAISLVLSLISWMKTFVR